jgi:molybdopterin-guanine dinucleotide biosynthesis protein
MQKYETLREQECIEQGIMLTTMVPKIIAISGTSSNCGKTTLLCDMLRDLSRDEAWEAIKLTRGHYRSCGKDPHACCVSHLLSAEPVVRSGREETYAIGKDTGLYWEAGASNVHWVIVTNDQVEQGIKQALDRVQSRSVFIEGTSFLRFIKADFAVLVARSDQVKLKPSARYALLNGLIDAIYLSGDDDEDTLRSHYPAVAVDPVALYTRYELGQLIDRVKQATIGPG